MRQVNTAPSSPSPAPAPEPDPEPTLDAGPAAVPEHRALWIAWDGGDLLDGGETDLLELTVGRTVELRLPRAVVLQVCDAPLVGIETRAGDVTLEVTGLRAGTTHCGFWYQRSPGPNRYFGVVVTPE